MSDRKKQWKILLFVTWVACLLFSSTKTFADFPGASKLELLTDISGYQLDNFPIKDLISSFCNELLQSQPFVQNAFVYNAQQSAFVYLLCRNIDYYSPYFKDQEKNYFNRLDFVQLWFQTLVYTDSVQTDLCDAHAFQNGCDLSVNIPKLFNGILNDYVNMKQPNLYGMNASFKGEDEIKNQINIFSSGYFDGVQICGTDNPYPTTCKMMQWYIKNVRNILSDVSILNASGILEISKTKALANVPCGSPNETTDLFYCGLYGDQWTSLPSFVNLVYNELFYYRLFMWYYLAMIQENPSLISSNTYMNDYSNILKTFSTQYMWSKDALSVSLRMMRDIYVAFPFHVGFTMYQEDLDGFWKALARIAPPIYTLYDKLRNVQKPQ